MPLTAHDRSHSFPCFPDIANMLARLLASAVLLVDLRVFSILGKCSTTEIDSQSSLYPCFISIISGFQKFLGNGVMAHVNRVVSLLHSELFPGDPTELACAPRGSRLDSSSLCTHTTQFTQHPPSEGHLLTGIELKPKLQQTLGCRFFKWNGLLISPE